MRLVRRLPPHCVPVLFALLWASFPAEALGQQGKKLPQITTVEHQPLMAQIERLIQALEFVGAPLPTEDVAQLRQLREHPDPARAVQQVQEILDRHVLFYVDINPESRVKVQLGPADPVLQEQGWRTFLVKVHNAAGVTAQLKAESPNALPVYTRASGSPDPLGRLDPSKGRPRRELVRPADLPDRFLDILLYDSPPLRETLSGLELEYRIVQLFSRDAGKREALISFNVGQGTQDIGFRNEVPVLFRCLPSSKVILEILDTDGRPTMASLEIRDLHGRVYPSPARRLAPDFFFHPQIYRQSGEFVRLPAGTYLVRYGRGPEYRVKTVQLEVPEALEATLRLELERWVHLKALSYYSGDHHIHAAGCSHYESPTEGVYPEDMMRHILGEDLNVGCVLSWGPCWYFQKQFFEGRVHPLSRENYLMRYDVEVSGFPSSHCGHLCLLNLREDDYQGPDGRVAQRIEEWPSWDLPILLWARRQGAVVGFAHSGWGLNVDTEELPNYKVPPMNGIGANEYIVDVTHDAVDFISAVDTPYVWELNIWYHTLNCGFRTKLSGETDFPCIFGQRVGIGRAYVKVDGPLTYEKWVDGLRRGRSYVTEGHSHLVDFEIEGVCVGEGDVLREAPGTVRARIKVAALLKPEPGVEEREIRQRPYWEKPYWHIERARLGESRKVAVEFVVNGRPVSSARREILADGTWKELEVFLPIERSSWVAARILGSSHTNPIWVLVQGKPVRASRRSAQWCLAAVDQCWKQKSPAIRPEERAEAEKAYEHARRIYQQIAAESQAD
jgi:hypothetical protein